MRTILLTICLIFASVNLYSQSNDELAKSDSLYAKGVEAYNQQDFAEAIRLTTEVLNIQERVFGKEHPGYATALNDLAKYHSLKGNYDEAVRLGTEALNIIERVLGKDNSDYAASLSRLSEFTSKLGNYADAIRLETEALNIRERVLGKDHPDYATSLSNLSVYHLSLGNYAEALLFVKESIDIRERILGKEHPDYVISLNNLAVCYSSMGDYEETIQIGGDVVNLIGQTKGKNHPDYATALNNLAGYNYIAGNYDDAIQLVKEALDIRDRILGKSHPDYIASLNNLAMFNFVIGNYSESIKYGEEILILFEQILGKEHPDYASFVGNLAMYNYQLGNYAEAIRLGTDAVNLFERVFGKEHPDYATSIDNLAGYLIKSGNFEDAIRLSMVALNIREKLLGKEHADYATSLSSLADKYSFIGNFVEAIKQETEAMNIRKCVLGKEHVDYATSVHNLARYYSALGNYSEAIKLIEEAIILTEKSIGRYNTNYAVSLLGLASYTYALGNYSKAIRLATEASNIIENVLGEEHDAYAMSLVNLAVYMSSIGDIEEAIQLAERALGIQERVFGKEHPDYATSLDNLAGYYLSKGDYDKSIQLGMEAKNLRERILGSSHPDVARSLSNQALRYSASGNYAEAIRLSSEAMKIREKNFGKEHPDYANSLSNMSLVNCLLNNYIDAIGLETEALNIAERLFGKDHPVWINRKLSLSEYYFRNNDLENTESSVSEVNSSYRDYIRNNFSNLTSTERRMFWDKEKYWFEDVINKYAHYINSPQLAADAYNMTLLAKGILLNSERDFSTLITESGDEDAIKTFDNLRMTRLQLNRLYEKPIAERFMDVDSLERVAQQLERELLERSKVYGDFTRNMAIDWNDVSQKLGPKDVAIEFVSFPAKNDSVIYAAYVLDPKMKNPEMVALFDERELSRIPVEDYYNKAELSRLVWGKLDSYINTAENIFFAPAGELYNIAIESLPDYERDGQLADHHNLYRLSSTRQLAVIKDKNPLDKVALYGDLKYDTDVKVLEKDADKYTSTVERSFSLINLPDSLNLRNGVWDLPATKIEVENINLSFNRKSVTSSVYTDTLGTEASFKALSGKRTNIIHIATHGFYWTDKEVRRMSNPGFILSNDLQGARYVEDKALTRTGLLFAGANNVLCGKPLPDNVQDGILTAREISTLDLKGLDMIVMSACQTGLGDITGDGVFGLQRGFKKAGANSLLMSLWKVDDRATQMLMTKFYDYYLSGKKKLESLTLAQKYLREYEEDIDDTECQELTASQQRKEKRQGADAGNSPVERIKTRPFANPKYWAAFILLDALD